MRLSRAIPSTSLAFIDVMSCGLGALILLFFLLDFNKTTVLEIEEPKAPIKQESMDLNALEAEKTRLVRLIQERSLNVRQLLEKVSNALVKKATNTVLIAQKTEENKKRKSILPQVVKDSPATGELIGLSVSGQRILILFDISASMSEETLIKIIVGIADKSGARLKSGPKWAQAKRIVAWTLKNAPPSSLIQILAYSDKVTRITSKWSSPSDALARFDGRVSELSPTGGTSLGKVLEFVQKNSIVATDLYVITDGLPTLSGSQNGGFSAIKSCFRLPSNKPKYVDGECREALFSAAVTRFQKGSAAKVNVILLPLEGDPKAAPQYWRWAAANGGVIFSPSKAWP